MNFFAFSKNPLGIILDLFFPRQNLYLSDFRGYLTDSEIESLQTPGYLKMEKNKTKQQSIFAVSSYKNEVIKDLILRAKFFGETEISKCLARLILKKTKALSPPDLITFVPPDPKRWKIRHYHLPQELAKNLSKLIKVPEIKILKKVVSTRPQTELDKEQRLVNLQGKFGLNTASSKYQIVINKGKTIWLLDDITTTGSTLGECEKVLNKNYPHLKIVKIVVAG